MRTPIDVYYKRIAEDPRWVNAISEAWKLLVLQYAVNIMHGEELYISRLIEVNPEYKYPDPNKKFEYWDEARQMSYTKARKVVSDIERSLAPPTDTSTPTGSIVEPYLLKLIFEKYGHFFEGETRDQWMQRFSIADINVPPIKVRADAREGSDRLILLAILSSIQTTTGNAFDFEDYVKKHFGIKEFYTAKSRNNKKRPFKEVVRDCDRILKTTTM